MKHFIFAVIASLVLSAPQAFADAAAGEALFNGAAKCKNCHKVTDKKKVGPGMAGVTKRVPEEWLKAWMKDPKGVWTANEGYTVDLKKAMKKESKPKPGHKVKKKLTDQDITDLIDFLKTL